MSSEPGSRNRSVRTSWSPLYVLVVVGLVTCFACGAVPGNGDASTGPTASATRTASPSAASTTSPATSLPDPVRFTSQNCSAKPPTTAARALGAYFTLRVAPSWTDTGDYVHTESLLLELTAPASYGNSPTRIRFLALPYDVKADFGSQATAHSIAQEDATTHQHFSGPGSTATLVTDCFVAAEPAAVFGYADGKEHGYWLLIVHNNRLLGVRLFGTDGIGDQAINDALGMIGSIAWTF
jgi:hypothetical protein